MVQGTTVIAAARRLKLVDDTVHDDDNFGVELPPELPTSLHSMTLTPDMLASGDTLSKMKLPPGSLVMMIRRDGRYIVPDGSRPLMPGDQLLIIREDDR